MEFLIIFGFGNIFNMGQSFLVATRKCHRELLLSNTHTTFSFLFFSFENDLLEKRKFEEKPTFLIFLFSIFPFLSAKISYWKRWIAERQIGKQKSSKFHGKNKKQRQCTARKWKRKILIVSHTKIKRKRKEILRWWITYPSLIYSVWSAWNNQIFCNIAPNQ